MHEIKFIEIPDWFYDEMPLSHKKKLYFYKLRKNKYVNNIINILEPILIVVILVVVTSYLIDNSYNPFLYFRF